MWENRNENPHRQVRKNTPIPASRRPRDESIADTSWCHPGSEGCALPLSALTGRSPAISARSVPYTLARRMSFTLCTAGAFQQTAPSLSGARRYCFRVTAYSFFSFSANGLFRAHHHTPVKVAALQSEDQHFRRSQIGGAGDVVGIAQMQLGQLKMRF